MWVQAAQAILGEFLNPFSGKIVEELYEDNRKLYLCTQHDERLYQIQPSLMPYRSSSKTRQKKDTKRTKMMQAAIRVFAKKGYHAATIRDIVGTAEVAIGTFYFYFPDKETLFVHLYDETADFLLQAIQQAALARTTFPQQIRAGLQAYVNIAVYEPAVVQLLLTGGSGSIPSLIGAQSSYRQRFINIWQELLETSWTSSSVAGLHLRRMAEALAGAYDEVILNLITQPTPEVEATAVVEDLVQFSLRATAYVEQP